MSIEAKHAYRFGFLKSDKWQSVRLDALVREGGKCQICVEESISNDAHHIWYPENIYDTTEKHLVILCRDCHNLIHTLYSECKTRDEGIGRANWISFRNGLEVWLLSKRPGIGLPTKTREFREAYDSLKKRYEALHREYQIAVSKLSKK